MKSYIKQSATLRRLATRVPAAVTLARRLDQKVAEARDRRRTERVPISRLLMGGEWGLEAARWARTTGDILRPSTPVSEGPQAKLLTEYAERGEALFSPGTFEQTTYYRNAAECLSITGRYFTARRPEEILDIARSHVARSQGLDLGPSPDPVYSRPGSLPRVRRIRYSDCYEVVDGHHRIALAAFQDKPDTEVVVTPGSTLTPLQEMVLDVLWTTGARELYQPLVAPEIGHDWPLIRNCQDRLDMMLAFLDELGLPQEELRYVDLGSSYGWFVAEMADAGFVASGVERDPNAIRLGNVAYGMDPGMVHQADLWQFLTAADRSFDVVSCFSVLHHFALGRGPCDEVELIELIDKICGRVLFFDTGQGHEAWFADELGHWDAAFIENWLRTHTSFDRIVRLGIDSDSRPPFEDNYGRTLFACVRH